MVDGRILHFSHPSDGDEHRISGGEAIQPRTQDDRESSVHCFHIRLLHRRLQGPFIGALFNTTIRLSTKRCAHFGQVYVTQSKYKELNVLFKALNTPGAAKGTWVLKKVNLIHRSVSVSNVIA